MIFKAVSFNAFNTKPPENKNGTVAPLYQSATKVMQFSFLLKNTSSLDELRMVKNKVFESKRISDV